MKNYILIISEDNIQFNNLDELIEYIFGLEYKTLDKKGKLYKRYEKAFYLKQILNDKNIEIVETEIGVLLDKYTYVKKEYDISKAIIVDDEITLIKSLCRYNKLILLEKIGIYKLHTIKDEERLKEKDNYIIINKIL